MADPYLGQAVISTPIGPSFAMEVVEAGIQGLPFSFNSTPGQVIRGASLSDADWARVVAAVRTHNPSVAGPPVAGPNSSCSKLGLKRAFDEKGLWPTVRYMISSSADMQEEWDLAVQIRISDPLIKTAVAALAQQGIALSDADLQALVNRANALVA